MWQVAVTALSDHLRPASLTAGLGWAVKSPRSVCPHKSKRGARSVVLRKWSVGDKASDLPEYSVLVTDPQLHGVVMGACYLRLRSTWAPRRGRTDVEHIEDDLVTPASNTILTDATHTPERSHHSNPLTFQGLSRLCHSA